jgi:hypothetical protein
MGTRVISIDPGGTNGVAIWDVDIKNKKYIMESCEGVKKDILFQKLENMPINVVLYEDYRLYSSHKSAMVNNQFETVQIIGVIKYIAGKRKIPVYTLMASAAKAFFKDDKLKNLGLYVTVTHKRDAIRHFLHWWYITKKYGNKHDLLNKK